jgi:hypothetical protein
LRFDAEEKSLITLELAASALGTVHNNKDNSKESTQADTL